MTTRKTTRRAILAGAASLSTLAVPAIATALPVASPNDADLIALGDRYEKLLTKYMDATLQWAPLARSAHAEICEVVDARQAAIDRVSADLSGPYPFDLIQAENRRLTAALDRNGGLVAENHMTALAEEMEPLAEAINTASASSLGGLRAKALVLLFEARPGMANHDGTLEFADDGGATRSLFDAVAEFTGLTPMVREIERRLADDATAKEAA